MPPQLIALQSQRIARMQLAGALQHCGAALVLLEAGIEQLTKHPGKDLAIGLFSVVSGGVLLVAVIFELQHARGQRKGGHAAAAHPHAAAASGTGINWMDLVAVPSLIAEGWHKAHRGAHYLPYVYFGLAAVTLLRGLLLDRLTGGCRVEIDARRLFVRTSPFRSHSVPWVDVADTTCTAQTIEIKSKRGAITSIDLRDARNRDAVFHAVDEMWATIHTIEATLPAPTAPLSSAAPMKPEAASSGVDGT